MPEPFSIWVQPTKRSNLNSLLAYDVPSPDATELTFEEITGSLQELFDRDVISAFFEGGEPLLREDFLDLVEFATPQAFTIVRTNGTLVTAERARRLKAASVGVVCVDIEGGNAASHDAIVGLDGAFEASKAGVRHLVEAGVPTFVTAILNRRNIGELQQLADLASELGAEKLGVLRLYPLGLARRNWAELSVPLREQMAALEAVHVPEGLELMRSWHPNDPNCCWQMAAIDAYGNSIGCPYLRDFANYGNVREMSFMDTWRDPTYRAVRAASPDDDACPECAENDRNRSGGCRSTAYAFGGSWDAPDPFCTHMNRGIDLTRLPDRIADLPFGAPRTMAPAP
ncbi:radical SAM protein [Streptomyces sp. NL15-2K]|uniref:radical SAM protein n=1 Tax=Streptomyces sp. NL15-2K TaxID=376149 RepID=UPI000FF9547F|nr:MULTISPECIES: radical SAM protein [Actinomycetes]WKX09532.1 radical SAM protein [Kutzneria buriramensis]GCB48955.1 radical SAM domain heme biosynthesis protein [Streptomyces sp. NL15-2K]